MKDEVFKKITVCENYSISNYGRVRNDIRNTFLSPRKLRGYERVSLWYNNKANDHRIHRLVAQEFIQNKENKPEVNHKDGNKLNNHVSNLEWNTTQENLEHKRINNLGKTLKAKLSATGINNSQAKLDEEDVIFIRTNCETKIDIKKFSKELDVSIATIYDIKNRRSWTHI